MSVEQFRQWCAFCYYSVVALVTVSAAFTLFVALNSSQVLSYGVAGDIYFDAKELHGGDTVNLWFKNTTWLRLCRSRFIQFVQIDGRRFDLGTHVIDPPAHTGPLPLKARPVKMPLFGDGVDGPAEFWAEVKSDCWLPRGWWTIETETPHVHFVVKAAQ